MARYEDLSVHNLRNTGGFETQKDGTGTVFKGSRFGGCTTAQTSETVVIAVAGTPVQLTTGALSAFAAPSVWENGVSITNHQYTIQWPGTRWARISAALGLIPAAGTVSLSMHFYVNGVSVAESASAAVANPNTGFFEMQYEMELSDGDVVTLAVENITDTANVTVLNTNGKLGVPASARSRAVANVDTNLAGAEFYHGYFVIES